MLFPACNHIHHLLTHLKTDCLVFYSHFSWHLELPYFHLSHWIGTRSTSSLFNYQSVWNLGQKKTTMDSNVGDGLTITQLNNSQLERWLLFSLVHVLPSLFFSSLFVYMLFSSEQQNICTTSFCWQFFRGCIYFICSVRLFAWFLSALFLFCVSFLFRIEKYFLKLFLSRQLEVAGLKEAGPVVEKEAVLRLTTFLIDKVG